MVVTYLIVAGEPATTSKEAGNGEGDSLRVRFRGRWRLGRRGHRYDPGTHGHRSPGAAGKRQPRRPPWVDRGRLAKEAVMTTATFDPDKYKTTTRAQWEAAAEAWDRWNATLDSWLGPVTERMLDLTGVRAGSSVLDVAAGAGGQTIDAARRVGPDGHVLATDISPAILQYAAARATEAGLTNVTTQEVDGEDLRVPSGHYDAVI